MFEIARECLSYGKYSLSIETGKIARQADGAVLVNMEDTIVLATVVARKAVQAGQDFLPMSVDYVEKSYAAGRIPGGFFKREGRPTERETLIARLIDRPLRPLFPKGFYNEVQVIVAVLSLNPDVDPDIPAIIAASAALSLSGIPISAPVAAARVGYVDGEFVLNPSAVELRSSQMNLVVSGTYHAVLMVESEARSLSEQLMLEAIQFGHQSQQVVINAIERLTEKAGKLRWDWKPVELPEAVLSSIHEMSAERVRAAYAIPHKQERTQALDAVRKEVLQFVLASPELSEYVKESELKQIFFDLESHVVRSAILAGQPRIDGRDTRTVRPITVEVGLLPRTHGSALFTRGETQALVVTTLGTENDAQVLDGLMNESKEHFMLHYNMPPYATGEAGRVSMPKRREIGHGRLAKRSLFPVLPSKEDFPYTVRLVSEITESNGSSSMASVCAGCLSLMDAGVPISSHVAGIAMGLIKEGKCFAVLSDILGDEDHLGDMDFKVAGTESGVTALQMDIKVSGIGFEIMRIALDQAKEARLHILAIMRQAISNYRQEVSEFAPRMSSIKINPEKIHLIIGRGGSTIKALTEETSATIDIQEDGTVTISSVVPGAVEAAQQRIEQLTMEVKVGGIYEGKVLRLLEFGAIVDIMPGRDGLLHVSKIRACRQKNIRDVFVEGQRVSVEVVGLDDKGRIRLALANEESDC